MTNMATEILSIPETVEQQIQNGWAIYTEAGFQIRKLNPTCLITCARGSSDHAALYFKYLIESRMGVPVCSMGPSIGSIYKQRLANESPSALLAVSQSGGSQDLASMTGIAADSGLATFALVNNKDSVLGQQSKVVLPMLAGTEIAVAATKTYVCSLVALAIIAASWSNDRALLDAIRKLPELLYDALQKDWSQAFSSLSNKNNLFVISRGPGAAIAAEAALKFKETCGIHAEAFSSAEVQHGPIALAENAFSAVVFSTFDETATSVNDTSQRLRSAGALVLQTTTQGANSNDLEIVRSTHTLLDPISQIASFYKAIEQLAVHSGYDPDSPALLSKVTVTV